MTSSGNNPNINPSDNDTLAGTLQFVFSQFMKSIDGMLPARVINFDRSNNLVQVELLIAMITTSGQQVQRAQIASLPVFQIGGGGFLLNFNLQPNDLGWVVANDRDISLFLQNFSQAAPNTNRVKNFADAVFFPHVMTGYSIASEDDENVVLQNLDGTLKVSLGTDIINGPRIKLTAPIVEITGDLKVDGEIIGAGGFTMTGGGGNTGTFTGNLRVVGDITASGNITPHIP